MQHLSVKILSPKASLPERAHEGDAGLDLRAAEDALVPAGGRTLVGTGIAIEMQPGQAALLLPRSGLALRKGVTVLNSPGLIDSGFRGEVGVVLYNSGEEDFSVSAGDRIAQLLLVAYYHCEAREKRSLSDAERGEGGFGSSGVS